MIGANRACKAPIAPWEQNPYGLVSLGEIMQYAEDEVHFGPFSNVFYALGRLEAGAGLSEISTIEVSVMLGECVKEMKRLGLRVSASNTENIVQILDGKYPGGGYEKLHDFITILRSSLHIELDSTVFLHVGYNEAIYYREPLDGTTEDVEDRFSSTLEDLREAARCYALGRYTASVFHCMRAVEVGLIALGHDLKVPAAKNKNWQELLNEINKAIKQVSEKTHGATWRDQRQWYSEVSAHLQVIKDAWRNDVMHVHRGYDQARAREILHATRAFMCQLAARLKE